MPPGADRPQIDWASNARERSRVERPMACDLLGSANVTVSQNRPALAASVVLLVAGAAGCFPQYSALVRRASNEFSCDPARVNVIARNDIAYGLHDVEACGQRARYNCVGGASRHDDPYRCIREPDPPRWDPDPAQAASLPADPREPPSNGGVTRRICGPEEHDCAFNEGGVWRWRPPVAGTCGGGFGNVCESEARAREFR
jgi:hypothetical protein